MKTTYFIFISIIVFSATDRLDTVLFLPIVTQGYCFDRFVYDEAVPWNLQAIDVIKVWDSCGSKRGLGITIAIVDSGIDLEHPDLKSNIVGGKSFVQNSSDLDDSYGHGTHLAGIIAAVANNGGVIGVAPRANLMPVKVLDATGSGSASEIAQGIVWAADHNANIINLSIGSPVPSGLVEDAVDYAYNAGVLIIGAAGNCGGEDYETKGCLRRHQLDYPGVYPSVIAVASVTIENSISSFSSHGDHIELAAPGEEIYSTYLDEGYKTLSGTSFAVAHTAGAAALIWSEKGGLSNEELRAIFQNTSIDLGESGVDEVFGYGLIDTYAALSATTNGIVFTTTIDPAKDLQRKWVAEEESNFISGEILIKIKSNAPSIEQLTELLGVQVLSVSAMKFEQESSFGDIYIIHVQDGTEQKYLRKLSNSAYVEYAELNYVYQAR